MSRMPSEMLHPQLAEYRSQHEEIRTRVERLLEEITPEQFVWSPAPDRWSVGQNLEHLRLAAEEQLQIIETLIGRGWAAGIRGVGPFEHGEWGERYIRFIDPPYRVRVPAHASYVPPRRVAALITVRGFFDCKRRMLDLIEVSSGLDLAALTAPLPHAQGWLPRLSLGQWFAYAAAHERRHLWQIELLRSGAGYPSAAA